MMQPALIWQLFEYNPLTGNFIRTDRGTTGSITNGYRTHCLEGKNRYAHQLIWCWLTGAWPAEQVDHIDGDKLNNSVSNLRLATNAQNGWNKSKQKNNTSGFKGVSQNKSKWKAEIQANGVRKHLGTFDCPEKAHEAYCAAASSLHGIYAKN